MTETGPVQNTTPEVTTRHTGRGIPPITLTVLRVVQFVFAVVVIGLIGTIINNNANIEGCYTDGLYSYLCFYTPASFKYTVFAGAWTILVTIAFLVVTYVLKKDQLIPTLAVDAISIILWFASFVAIAVWLGNSDRLFGEGFTFGEGRALLQAATVFGAFLWLLFIATFVLNFRAMRLQKSSHVTPVPMQQQSPQQYQQPPPQQYQQPPPQQYQQPPPQQYQQSPPPSEQYSQSPPPPSEQYQGVPSPPQQYHEAPSDHYSQTSPQPSYQQPVPPPPPQQGYQQPPA